MNDTDTIDTVAIVGGGDNGLITALLVKQLNPEIDVSIVDNFDEEQPEIGKSTVVYILHILHRVLDIDEDRFIKEVKPGWKFSIYFDDWCGNEFYVPFDEYHILRASNGPNSFSELYYRHEHQEFHTLCCELVEQRKTPFIGENDIFPQMAYHLNINRTNEFLREVCQERGIQLFNDVITDVHTEDNRICAVTGQSQAYEADLYIDASGYNRALVGQLGTEFVPFDYPIDSALVAKTDVSLSEIVPATVATSAEYGWFWQIDTTDWRDLGYVHGSEFVSPDDAQAEFIAHVTERGGDITASDIMTYQWEAGIHKRAWVNNCVAVGNAFGFLEPLESTTFTLNAIIAEKLANMISNHGRINHPGLRELFNTFVRTRWTNAFDFVSLHYQFTPERNEFWRAMQTVNRSDRVKQLITDYHENGFNSHYEFDAQQEWHDERLFSRYLFYRLLRSVGVKSDFYEGKEIAVSEQTTTEMADLDQNIRKAAAEFLSHEEAAQLAVYQG